MKKLYLLCCIIIAILCCGCENSPMTGAKECPHDNYELEGVRYEYGPCCEDPKTIYVICSDCGEEVKAGQVKSDRKCSSGFNKKELVRESTCTEEGLVKWVCEWCGTEHSYSLEKLEHLYMHFWGEDKPRCVTCGVNPAEEPVGHVCEYELDCTEEYSTKFREEYAGVRYYNCKSCDNYYAEYFDGYGDFDLEAAIASIRDEAKKAGYQVIIDTDKLTSSNDYQAVDRELEYSSTNSIELTQDVTDIAKELLQYALMYHSDPTECYMVVQIEYIGDKHNARFHIELRIEHTGSFINHWYVHNPIV